MDQFRANFKTIPDLGAAMIALRSPTTCSTERPRSQTSESSDVRTGNQARPARSLFERLALKTVILLILLIVPDLIRSERADFDAQQNNYHTTAGRHIERDETHPGEYRWICNVLFVAGRAGRMRRLHRLGRCLSSGADSTRLRPR